MHSDACHELRGFCTRSARQTVAGLLLQPRDAEAVKIGAAAWGDTYSAATDMYRLYVKPPMCHVDRGTVGTSSARWGRLCQHWGRSVRAKPCCNSNPTVSSGMWKGHAACTQPCFGLILWGMHFGILTSVDSWWLHGLGFWLFCEACTTVRHKISHTIASVTVSQVPWAASHFLGAQDIAEYPPHQAYAAKPLHQHINPYAPRSCRSCSTMSDIEWHWLAEREWIRNDLPKFILQPRISKLGVNVLVFLLDYLNALLTPTFARPTSP